ncbi:unnamed protein product [Rotaria sp. Silwood1]|nr:unnamed protein product [Rotaria sp. Silwood1]
MMDENTRPFTINHHHEQHLFNTRRERDCDEYHYRSSRDDDMNDIYTSTLRELDNERDKRWRAEQEIKHLNDIINEFKKRVNDGRTNETILHELTEKHKQRLADEKSKFQDLTAILDDYKARLRSTDDQLCSYKKAQETNLQLIKTLESSLSKLESEKNELRITENEKIRNWERRCNTLQNENEILQQELKTIKQQLRECQELYTTREIQHKQEFEKCRIDLQATEVQQYIKQEIQRKEDIHRTEMTHQQEKNVTEFEDRWTKPVNTNQVTEMNTYVNPMETQQRLDIFSNVKAATILPAVETNHNNSNEEKIKKDLSEETSKTRKSETKETKTKISFRDKKKIAYENRIRAYSTPDKIFRYFATLKVYSDENPDGTICMTPDDFLRSITPGLKQPDGLELDKFQRYDFRVDLWEKLEHLNTHLYYSELNSDQTSIFERIGGKQCLITFSDYIFLVTLLSTPKRCFQIAFQMFDLDGNGNFDFDEFTKLKNLIREQTTIGQKHRDHSTTGNILRETSTVNQYFFGENLDQLLTIEKFLQFYEQLQYEILQLEFHRATKCPNDKTRMTELDFAMSLLAYSGLSDKHFKKMLKRVKKSYPIDDETKSIGISFKDYENFHNFLRNIHDIDVALTFYHIAGGAIDKQIFAHVAKIVNHIELDSHLIDVVFTLFDENEDQLLSYVEFIQLMKNRLERGLQRPKDTAFMKLFSTMITCAKETYL